MSVHYFQDSDGSFSELSTIKVPGYKYPEGFPLGNPFTKNVYDNTRQWLTQYFPNLNEERLYQTTIEITSRVDSTRHIIATNKDSDNWDGIMTDYIEAMVFFFKKHEIGLPCYLREITNLILSNTDITPHQKELLACYINSYKNNSNQWPSYSALELYDAATLEKIQSDDSPDKVLIMADNPANGEGHLIGTFQKWLKIFPFEIGCFGKDKQYFIQRFSDFTSRQDQHTNQFLNLTFRTVKTHAEFITFLIDTTKELLQSVQSIEWTETADPSDVKLRQLALIRHSHKITQENLLAEFNDGEKVYIKVLKEWLKNEKTFFEEFIACLPKTDNNKTPQPLGAVTEFFPMTLVGKLHDYCNEQQFELESIELYQILNTPDKWEKPVKVNKGEIGRMEYLMSKINGYLEKMNTSGEIHPSICRIFGLNPQNCLRRGKLPDDFYKVNEKYMEQIQMILSSETN